MHNFYTENKMHIAAKNQTVVANSQYCTFECVCL